MYWVYDHVTKITILMFEEKNILIGNINSLMALSAIAIILNLPSKL